MTFYGSFSSLVLFTLLLCCLLKLKVSQNWQFHALQLELQLKFLVNKQYIFQHLLHRPIGKWCLLNFWLPSRPSLYIYIPFPHLPIKNHAGLWFYVSSWSVYSLQLPVICISCTSFEVVLQFALEMFSSPQTHALFFSL